METSLTSAKLRLSFAALAAGALLSAGPATAAITWFAPVDSTGKSSDVINTGELLDAGTFGATTTVNGVTFQNIGLGVPNTSNYGVLSNYGQFSSDWDPEYRTLVASTAYFVLPTQVELQLGTLAAGKYMMQLFLPQWDANWATAFSLNGVFSAPVQAGGALAGGPNYPGRTMPQWVKVEFDADGVTEYAIRTEGVTRYQLLSAFQLRTVPSAGAIPEPSTWAMMILGFGLAGAACRRRKQAACAA